MALTDPKNTLAYHNSRVLGQHRDMSKVPLSNVVNALSAFRDMFKQEDAPPLMAVPEAEALAFYGMNHGVALISSAFDPYEPLPEWELGFVAEYHELMAMKARRAFSYLLIICTREARHCHHWDKLSGEVGKQFGAPVLAFLKGKSSEDTIHEALMSEPPSTTIGNYCSALDWVFYNGNWGGGYGGPAWGKVTDCLCNFVYGTFTAEMMLDTIWTLCHNNGPIFNKGHFYGSYGHNLIKLLDVQRGGMIPEGILFEKVFKPYSNANLLDRMGQLKDRYPGKIGDYVDWFAVEALGAVQQYADEKVLQVKAHGLSPIASELQKLAAAAEAAKLAAKEAEEKKFKETHFEVMPGVTLKKFKQKRQAA